MLLKSYIFPLPFKEATVWQTKAHACFWFTYLFSPITWQIKVMIKSSSTFFFLELSVVHILENRSWPRFQVHNLPAGLFSLLAVLSPFKLKQFAFRTLSSCSRALTTWPQHLWCQHQILQQILLSRIPFSMPLSPVLDRTLLWTSALPWSSSFKLSFATVSIKTSVMFG